MRRLARVAGFRLLVDFERDYRNCKSRIRACVCVQAKARAKVRAKEEKDEDDGT